MLFDLEDYRVSGAIGAKHTTADKIFWDDHEATHRASMSNYIRAIRDYYWAAQIASTPSERQQVDADFLDLMDAYINVGKKSRIFWPALVSLPVKGHFQEGDRFVMNFVSIGDTTTGVDYHLPLEGEWYYGSMKYVATLDASGDYTYSELTQEMYDDYKNALVAFQAKVKTLMLHGEGQSVFQEVVVPEIPAWAEYPELSGYVRDNRSLPIKDAIVRLIDADGANHEIVTDSNGYYKFTKEFIYNNVALGATGSTSFELQMNVLPTKADGVTSLYDTTSVFQNSFFGAVNDRGFTWNQHLAMDKPARRNFKTEIIPDYSSYPSFSGYVKDAAGNPIKDAFVIIKDSFTGYSIGEYLKPNGNFAMNFKYNDFGVERTVLTDENGFYEYTSQMVGEWFNKQLMRIGDTPGKLGGRTFDEYFGSREDLINVYDSFSGRNLQYKESFFALLIPYKQNADSSEISWDGQPLYDQNDYYASRFKYALNPYGEFQYQRIDLNAHYDIDVDVVVAANDEVRADKFTVELLAERKNLDSGLSSQTYVSTTSGYFKVVYPTTGESYVGSSGWYYSYWHLNISYNNADDYKDFYIYSCDSQGRAMGYIKSINSPSFTKAIDLSGVKYLSVFNPINFYGESIDFSGLEYLEEISLTNSSSLKNVIGLESKKAYSLYLFKLSALENIDISGLTGLTQLMLEYLPALQSLDVQSNTKLAYIASSFADIALDVSGLTRLNHITFNKLTMTSDDVDDLLIQLASMAPDQDGNNISNGTINIDRISRSSYSDDAYATLSQRNWNINLGGYFYDEEIIPNKLIIEVDPSLASSTEWMDMYPHSIITTTGYWIGKLWNGQLIGNVGFANNNTNISAELRLGTTDARVEIFSCNEYGVPAGEITSIQLNHPKIKGVDTSELSELEHFDIYYSPGSGSPYSTIESLDFTQNHNLKLVNISGSNVESIDLTGLVSLETLTLSFCPNLGQITGFSSLSSLKTFGIERMPSLGYHSLAGLEDIHNVYISEVDLYDSTHVDTMLADLRTSVETAVASIDSQLYIKQEELAANQADWNLLMADLQSLYGELNQLVSDGAPQSSIDAKQSEIDAKEILNNSFYEQSQIIGAAISSLGTDRESHFGGTFNTNYMARTSASDADYASLLQEYSWNLYIGSEFIAPYTAPVKGFVTYDWRIDQDGNNYIYLQQSLKFSSTTGYVKYVSGIYSGVCNVGTDISSLQFIYGNVAKGILEFWSCDSHGRPSGNITGFGHHNGFNDRFMSFDISNLTEVKNLQFYVGGLTSMDFSSNTKVERIAIDEYWNLESIVGFEGFTSLKDCYFQNVQKLDIPIDFTSMPNLQRIHLVQLGISKNSRLEIAGLDKLQHLNADWTYLISEDLDNALMALDAAGLNSESDFAYEGHLDFLGSLYVSFGMGIGRHAIADAAYASLESKGWALYTGDQIVDSIEDPTKGIVRWSANTGWAAIAFQYDSGRNVRVRRPDGYIQDTGTMFSWSFDNSWAEEDRFIEFWEVDNWGRPRHGGITEIYDNWYTGITSVEIKNLTGIRNIRLENSLIQSLDLSGMPNLWEIYVGGGQLLESIIIDSAPTGISRISANGCPALDIDTLLQSLDDSGIRPIGSRYNEYNFVDASTSIASNWATIESLNSKRWRIDVVEPASAPVIFNVTGPTLNISVGCSTGYAKIVFPAGSQLAQQYQGGWIGQHGRYYDEENYGNTQFSIDVNNFRGQISIFSVRMMPDGSIIDSGKVRYFSNDGDGDLNYSTAGSIKSFRFSNLYPENQSKIAAISNLNLDRIAIGQLNYGASTLDLSGVLSKTIAIEWGNAQSVLFNKNAISKLIFNYIGGVNSIDLAGATMSSISINSCQQLETIALPADLISFYTYDNPNISVDLDFSVMDSIRNISIYYSNQISSIDVSNCSNLYELNLYQAADSVIGLETTGCRYFAHQEIDGPTDYEMLLPAGMNNIFISSRTVQSMTISCATSSYQYNCYLTIYDSNFYYGNGPISSLSIPNNYMQYSLNRLSVLPDLSTFNNSTVYLYYPQLSSIDLDVNVGELIIIDSDAAQDQKITSVNISGTASTLRLERMGWHGFGFDGSVITNQARGVSVDLSNLSRGLDQYGNEQTFYLNFVGMNNLQLAGIDPNTSITMYGNMVNIDLSGKTFLSAYINASGFTNDIDVSGSTFNNLDIMWSSFVTSINLDGVTCQQYPNGGGGYITIMYNTPAPSWNSSTTKTFPISMVSANAFYTSVNTNKRVSTIDMTNSSIRHLSIINNQSMTGLTASLKGTENFNCILYNVPNYITITGAGLSSLLNYVGIQNGGGVTLTSAIVDSVINAISETSRTGKTMRLRNMTSRTSASQAAYNKLIGQSWNMYNE